MHGAVLWPICDLWRIDLDLIEVPATLFGNNEILAREATGLILLIRDRPEPRSCPGGGPRHRGVDRSTPVSAPSKLLYGTKSKLRNYPKYLGSKSLRRAELRDSKELKSD